MIAMPSEAPDAAEQYKSEYYQRTVELERMAEDGITAEQCYAREAVFALDSAGVTLYPRDRVLDLACGVGEHARRIRERTGADIDAFDLSATAIQGAASQESLLQATGDVRGKISFALGDMGKILEQVPRGKRYRLITILGASFIYLPDKAAYQKALADYYSLLEPGGKLVLQFRIGKPKDQRKIVPPNRMTDSQRGDSCYYYGGDNVTTDVDGINHYSFGRVYISPDGVEHDLGTAQITDFFDFATRSHHKLVNLLRDVGFKNISEQKRPLSDNGIHDMVVIVAEK